VIGKVVGVALAAEVVRPGTVTVRNVTRLVLCIAAGMAALLALWITVTVVVVALRPEPVSTPNCAQHAADATPMNQICLDSPDRR
jgi:hypothetical protein